MNTNYTLEQAIAAFHEGKVVGYTRPSGVSVHLQEIKVGNPKGQPSYGFGRYGECVEHTFVTKSPEASIREAMAQAESREIHVLETVKLGSVTRPPLTEGLRIQSPEEFRKNPDYQPVLVPLGPNETRNGMKVRVTATDLAHKDFPVIYVRVNGEGIEHSPMCVNSQGELPQ